MIFNEASGTTTIEINDDIGFWGITQQEISNKIKDVEGDIVLNVSTYGGSTTDAFAIYNMLRSHNGNVKANIYGDTASSGTLIALAADHVEISENVMFLIHNAWTCACGNAEELREMADTLDKVDENIVSVYKKKTGLNKRQILALMSKEEWWTAKQAKEHGFVDKVVEPAEILNRTPQIIMNSVKNKDAAKALINHFNMSETPENNVPSPIKDWFEGIVNKIETALAGKPEETVKIADNEEVLAKFEEMENEAATKDAKILELENQLKEAGIKNASPQPTPVEDREDTDEGAEASEVPAFFVALEDAILSKSIFRDKIIANRK